MIRTRVHAPGAGQRLGPVFRPQSRPGRSRELQIQKVTFKDNYTTAELEIPDLEVCDQVLLEMYFEDAPGAEYTEEVYLTVHAIPER